MTNTTFSVQYLVKSDGISQGIIRGNDRGVDVVFAIIECADLRKLKRLIKAELKKLSV